MLLKSYCTCYSIYSACLINQHFLWAKRKLFHCALSSKQYFLYEISYLLLLSLIETENYFRCEDCSLFVLISGCEILCKIMSHLMTIEQFGKYNFVSRELQISYVLIKNYRWHYVTGYDIKIAEENEGEKE